MLHERCLELIHAEIDGSLSAQDRAELNRYLLADPEIRRVRDDFRNACRMLDGLEPLAVPRDYATELLARVGAQAPVPSTRARPVWQQPLARYAASFGAGVVLTVLALGSPAPSGADRDLRALAGTMAAHPATPALEPGTARIDAGQVHGQMRLVQAQGAGPVLEFDLETGGAVELVAEYNGRTVHLVHDGKPGSRSGVLLGEPAESVQVRILVAGQEIYQTVLHNAG